jgi:hypothetical protein
MTMKKDKIFVITNQKEILHDVVAPDAWFRKLCLTNVLPSFSSIVKIRSPVLILLKGTGKSSRMKNHGDPYGSAFRWQKLPTNEE